MTTRLDESIGKSSLTNSVLLAGHVAIAAPLPAMAGVGSLTRIAKVTVTLSILTNG
jgi:hypothetical protein